MDKWLESKAEALISNYFSKNEINFNSNSRFFDNWNLNYPYVSYYPKCGTLC